MGSEREFDQYMNELMALLQKIIDNDEIMASVERLFGKEVTP